MLPAATVRLPGGLDSNLGPLPVWNVETTISPADSSDRARLTTDLRIKTQNKTLDRVDERHEIFQPILMGDYAMVISVNETE